MLKLTNKERTAAAFNGAFFVLAAPEAWHTIGDGPTREAVLAWLADGNVAEQYQDPPPPVPRSVSMRQAREALIRRNMLATVETHLAGMAGIEGEIARNEWTHSQVVERGRPLTLAMAQVLGLTIPEQLDELFVFAATL